MATGFFPSITTSNPVSLVLLAMSLLNCIVGTPGERRGMDAHHRGDVLPRRARLAALVSGSPALAIVATRLGLAAIRALAKINGIMLMIAVNSIYATDLFLGTPVFLRHSGRIGTRLFVAASAPWAPAPQAR